MADARMNIVITAVNEAQKVLDDAATRIGALSKGLESLGITSTRKAGEGLNDVDAAGKKALETSKRLHAAVDGLSGAMQTLERWARIAAGGFLAFEAVRIIKDFADVAARSEELQLVLSVVGRNAGYTAKQLDDTDTAVQRLGITASASRQSLAQFIQSGLDIAKAGELARTAQNLAVISGENSSQTFARMVNSIQTLDTLSLRFMGITVDNQRAQEMYALSLGRSAQSLSEVEKRTALMTAVQIEAKKIGDIYSESMTSVGKQLGSLDRFIEEAKRGLADNLLPAYLAIVEELSRFLAEMELVGTEMDRQGNGAQKLGDFVRAVAKAIFGLTEFLVRHWEAIVMVTAAYFGLTRGIMLFQGALVLLNAFKSVAIVAELLKIAQASAVMTAMLTGGIGVIAGLAAAAAAYAGISFIKSELTTGVEGKEDTTKMTAAQQNQALHSKIETSKALREKMDNMTDKGSEEYKETEREYNASIRERQQFQKQMVRQQHEWELELAKTTMGKENDARRAYLMAQIADAKRLAEEDAKLGKDRTARQNRDIDIMNAAKALGLDKFSLTEGNVFSQGSAAAVSGFAKILDDFTTKAVTDSGLVSVSFTRMRESLLSMVSQAKTVDDFAAVLEQLGNSAEKMDHLKTTISELARTAWANREKVEAKELATIMSGYYEKLKEVQTVQNLLLTTSNLAYKGQLDLLKAEAELAFNKREEYALTIASLNAEAEMKRTIYERDLASTQSTEGRGREIILEKQRTREQTMVKESEEAKINIQRKYELEAAKVGADHDELRRQRIMEERRVEEKLETDRAKTAADTERQIADNHNENQKKRLDLAKTYYADLDKLGKEYLAEYRKHSLEVINIENKIRDTRERFNTDLRAMNRSVMSDAAARADKEKEINELEEKGRDAEKIGRTELASQYYEKQYTLAKSLASDPGLNPYAAKQKAAEEMERATKNLTSVEDTQRKIAAEAAESDKKKYDETLVKLKQVEAYVKSLGAEQVLRITPELNSGTLWSQVNKAVEEIHDKFAKGLDLSVKVANGAVASFVKEIQDYLDHNPVKLALQNFVNGLSTPVLSPAGASAVSGSSGSSASGATNRVALDLTVNKSPLGTLTGDQNTVQGLVSTLREYSRGGGGL